MDTAPSSGSTGESETLSYAKEVAEWRVKSGFWRLREIITDIADLIEDENSEITAINTRAKVKDIVSSL